ncbi:hypothetical protein VP01_1981g9 [Puccinia sorghi]|uniref:Uncharacterized protein n=1 Tax=Puccinia sorghi TaxID=27349 RepID=A0A0L6VDI8_9BASI|nr:hypothetical protein VP01_1981g9 [Puccinia sorghi]
MSQPVLLESDWQEQPTFLPSQLLEVIIPPLSATPLANLTTNFKLFMLAKSGKKTIWMIITPKNDFLITVTTKETTLKKFQQLIVSRCKNIFTHSGLPHIRAWLKSNAVDINKKETYLDWIDMAFKAKQSVYGVALNLKMANPADLIKHSQQEALLAKRVAHQEAIKQAQSLFRQAGEDSGEEIDPEEWNNFNFHMQKICKNKPVHPVYDRKTLVFARR